MAKGLLILLIVFAVVAILGWGMNKLRIVSSRKKQRFLKYYFIGYGTLMIVLALETSFSHKNFNFIPILQGILGVIMILLVVFGKLEKQSEETN
jgi:hypothetical protein